MTFTVGDPLRRTARLGFTVPRCDGPELALTEQPDEHRDQPGDDRAERFCTVAVLKVDRRRQKTRGWDFGPVR